MLNGLNPEAISELERALSLKLTGSPSAAERRVRELGALAALLSRQPVVPGDPDDIPAVQIDEYERFCAEHAPDAPDHRRLVERYGSWLKACRAAYELLPDGRSRGPGHPWPSPTRGKRRVRAYTKGELHAAIRRCGVELGRAPSSGDFHRWTREKKRLARLAGVQPAAWPDEHPRFSSISVLYRFYPHGENRWRLALADSNLTEVELAAARARRLLGIAVSKPHSDGAVQRLLDAPELIAACGFTSEDLKRIRKDGFGWLLLSQAAKAAADLGGSLDWLAGRSLEMGAPPPADVAFDRANYERLLKEKRLAAKEVREALDLTQSPYAALLAGRREPLVAELVVLAGLLNVTIDELVAVAEDAPR